MHGETVKKKLANGTSSSFNMRGNRLAKKTVSFEKRSLHYEVSPNAKYKSQLQQSFHFGFSIPICRLDK